MVFPLVTKLRLGHAPVLEAPLPDSSGEDRAKEEEPVAGDTVRYFDFFAGRLDSRSKVIFALIRNSTI